MDQRKEAVRLVAAEVSVSEVAERVGVSRQAVYDWLERHRADPESGLNDRSRRPHSSPTRTDAAIEQRVIAERKQWGFGRLNRTLLESTAINPAHDNAGQQVLFDAFCRMFNEERPH